MSDKVIAFGATEEIAIGLPNTYRCRVCGRLIDCLHVPRSNTCDGCATFERIDAIRSVTEMMSAVGALGEAQRREIILTALGRSRFQFTWSYIAEAQGIPESDWPPCPSR